MLIRGTALAALAPPQVRPVLRTIVRECRLRDAVPVLSDLHDAVGQTSDRSAAPACVMQLAAEPPGAIAITLGLDRMPRLDFRLLVQVTPGIRRPRGAVAALGARARRRRHRGAGVAVRGPRASSRWRGGRRMARPDLAAFDRAARSQLNDRLGRLGRRLDARVGFDDLVVADETLGSLFEIVAALRARRKVRERGRFRGAVGISALFSSDAGVGKTMRATVIGLELGARFALSGGFIKIAAEHSVLQAAALREPISTRDVVVTVHRMYRERGNALRQEDRSKHVAI